MTQVELKIKRIQEKLQLLLKQHTALQKENLKLKEELAAAAQLKETQQKNIEELKQQVQILKLNAGEMNGADKKEFEKRINGYLKEIEKAIILLGE